MIEEDKVTLTRTRAELVDRLATAQLLPPDRVRIQGELSIINAKIKALNTTEAAMNKAAADQRKIAGLAEAQANAQRAVARAQAKHGAPSTPPKFQGPGVLHGGHNGGHAFGSQGDDDDDPGQTVAIDGWIDAVLLRHDVPFTRSRAGKLSIVGSPGWAPVIGMLIDGIYAAARGQELPDLPRDEPKNPKVKSKSKKG